MKKLAAKYIARRSGWRNPALLRSQSPVQWSVGKPFCPEATSAVVKELNSLIDDGLVTTGIQVAAHGPGGEPLLSVWAGQCATSFSSTLNAGDGIVPGRIHNSDMLFVNLQFCLLNTST
jgi:hypothetical protein